MKPNKNFFPFLISCFSFLIFLCFPIDAESQFDIITCASSAEVTNVGGVNNFSSYQRRTGFTFNGPEKIYSFTPTVTGAVCIEIVNRTPNVNVDLFVLTNATDASSNILWVNGFPGFSSCFFGVAGTEYFFVVDGFTGSEATLSINISCSTESDLTREEISCETGLVVTNEFGYSLFDSYPQNSGSTYAGPEGVYPLAVDLCGQVCINVTDRDPNFPVDIFIAADSPDPTSSILRIDGTVGSNECFNAVPGTSYFLIVDGLFSVSSLEIDFSCTRCNIPEPIPTLGEWGLLCLLFGLLIIGITAIKQRALSVS